MKPSTHHWKTKEFAATVALVTGFALILALAPMFAKTARRVEVPGIPAQPGLPAQPVITHPYPQFPEYRGQTPKHEEKEDGTLCITTSPGPFPPQNPFRYPPGSNFLPTVYTDMFDSLNHSMPNTLPSSPGKPYNLHDGDPVITEINPTSPTDDLRQILDTAFEHLTGTTYRQLWGQKEEFHRNLIDKRRSDEAPEARSHVLQGDLKRAIAILEGEPVANRAYSGFPLLHYKGPEKIRKVEPILNAKGMIVGGNINVHQVWYDGHIESDTSYLDMSAFQSMSGDWVDVPWTITYTIDVLNRGADDFSPWVMYFDHPNADPKGRLLPHVGMDQTFFPMASGTRTVLKVKMSYPKYLNLVYTWGWRQHPPRVQVMERAGVLYPPKGVEGSQRREQYEIDVFGGKGKNERIAMIGDLAPEKRMWTAFRAALKAIEQGKPDYKACIDKVEDARKAYLDWTSRTQLPKSGELICPDPHTDLTLLYVNNTLYGELSEGGWIEFSKWKERGTTLKVTLYNGDYYKHGYLNVDFGGARGWENQFKSSERLGGSGCQFTFGRDHWSFNMDMTKPVILEPATVGTLPKPKKVFITFNFEPSRRLRFYQFDPLHHDVCIYSLH